MEKNLQSDSRIEYSKIANNFISASVVLPDIASTAKYIYLTTRTKPTQKTILLPTDAIFSAILPARIDLISCLRSLFSVSRSVLVFFSDATNYISLQGAEKLN